MKNKKRLKIYIYEVIGFFSYLGVLNNIFWNILILFIYLIFYMKYLWFEYKVKENVIRRLILRIVVISIIIF